MRTAGEDVHHRSRHHARCRSAQVPIQGQGASVRGSPRRRHRNSQNRVRSQPSLVGRAIQLDQPGVERALGGGVNSGEGFRNLAVNIGNCLQNALAEVLCLVTITQFDSLVLTRRRATRHDVPRTGAAIQKNFSFNGRIATRVKHLASTDIGNTAKRHKCVLYRSDLDTCFTVETRLAAPVAGEAKLYRSSRPRTVTSAAKSRVEKLDLEFDFGWRCGLPLR